MYHDVTCDFKNVNEYEKLDVQMTDDQYVCKVPKPAQVKQMKTIYYEEKYTVLVTPFSTVNTNFDKHLIVCVQTDKI